MIEHSLLQSIYCELDREKMDGATELKEKDKTFRRMEVHYESVPQITAFTAEERELPYLTRYYLYVNDEKRPANLKRPEVKQVIYEFYHDHFPNYLKPDLPEDLGEVDILDCFNVFAMPDYRPEHAFPGLITMEEVRSGRGQKDDRAATFPGLELFGSRRADGVPAAADFEGYTAFGGDRESAKNKLDEMKAEMAGELASYNVDGILDDVLKKNQDDSEEEPDHVS